MGWEWAHCFCIIFMLFHEVWAEIRLKESCEQFTRFCGFEMLHSFYIAFILFHPQSGEAIILVGIQVKILDQGCEHC